MVESVVLLPTPRRIEQRKSSHVLSDNRLMCLDAFQPGGLLPAAHRLQKALRAHSSLAWEVVASPATTGDLIALTVRVAPSAIEQAQGYRLSISPETILLEAHDEAGAFYGICTLIQIISQSERTLPCQIITDWPDFPARGVMLDISRDRVPTMDTLYSLVDMLAGWKVNQLQLYTENTFAYRAYPEAWALASPVTGQEMLELDAYCRERYVELVPNQNSFGHMERWMIHPRFAALSEGVEPNMTLCPTDPAGLKFVATLFDELLPHFSSRLFNVGCDETQVGEGRSKDECERRGAGRVYLDFLMGIYREVEARGRTMQFWGDIIMKHPELIPELPKDTIALEWGYSANHPFADHGAKFAASGIPFYVCPGTSSWQSLSGRTDNALANMLGAAEHGRRHGAIGYLNTDWGDRGHWQVLPVSFLPFAAGAAYSWCVDSNRSLDTAQAASMHAFEDSAGVMGRVAFNLGNVYKVVEQRYGNSSSLFRILQTPLDEIPAKYPGLTVPDMRLSLSAIDQAMSPLALARIQRPDAALIKAEFENTARLLRHACWRGLLALGGDGRRPTDLRRELDLDMFGAIQEYARLWLARNRSGGLADSVRRLEKARRDYKWFPFEDYPC